MSLDISSTGEVIAFGDAEGLARVWRVSKPILLEEEADPTEVRKIILLFFPNSCIFYIK